MRGNGLIDMENEALAFILGCVALVATAAYAFYAPSMLSVGLLLAASLFLCAATGVVAFDCGVEWQKDKDDTGEDR